MELFLLFSIVRQFPIVSRNSLHLWKLWKGKFLPFSSVIPSWSLFPLVEGFSRLVERREQKKREDISSPFLL